MTAREFFEAFSVLHARYRLELAFDLVNGNDSMHRFACFYQGQFFNTGRDRRNALLEQYGRLDPLISGIILDQLRANWVGALADQHSTRMVRDVGRLDRKLALDSTVRVGLHTCGADAAALVPALCSAADRGYRRAGRAHWQPLHCGTEISFLSDRYAVGAAFIISSWLGSGRWRWQLLAPKPLSTPSAIAVSDEDST